MFCTVQELVDGPDSVSRPLKPMKRPRSVGSGSSVSLESVRTAHSHVHVLRQQLQQAQAFAPAHATALAPDASLVYKRMPQLPGGCSLRHGRHCSQHHNLYHGGYHTASNPRTVNMAEPVARCALQSCRSVAGGSQISRAPACWQAGGCATGGGEAARTACGSGAGKQTCGHSRCQYGNIDGHNSVASGLAPLRRTARDTLALLPCYSESRWLLQRGSPPLSRALVSSK